jgi:phosphoribosylamine--glycine ligase
MVVRVGVTRSRDGADPQNIGDTALGQTEIVVRLLLIDQESMGLDFALRAKAAGWDVRWYRFSNGKPIRDGEGFGLTIVDDWRGSIPWVGKDGLIWLSGNFRFLQELDRFREFGFNIFGPTAASAALEIKRSAGLEAMRAVGIEVPPYQEFASLEDAEKFARKSDRAYVFKTLGDEDDKSLSFVADDPAELVGWIQQKIARGMKLKGPCLLQEKIDMLCEVGVSGWMGSDGFLPDRWQFCFEHKKLMNDEIGPNTGEMGTVTQYSETDKLADEMLKPMEPILRTLGHRGDFAIGAGIDKSGRAWPFEFTARAGWPCFFIQLASHRGDPARWMLDALNGRDTLKVSHDVAIGVVLAQPMFPYNKSPPERVEGNPIAGFDEVWPDIHPVSVMRGRGPQMKDGKVVDGPNYQTTGEYVAVATSLGKSIEVARKKVYGVVDHVHFPDMIHRTDIGEKVAKVLPKLHSYGYALDMKA